MVVELKLDMDISKIPTEAVVEGAIANLIQDFSDKILFYAKEYLVQETNQITSTLLRSGRVEFDRKVLEGAIIFSAAHAAFVEFGTRPHTAPLGASVEHRKLSRGKRKGQIIATSTPDPTRQPLDFWAWRLREKDAMHCWDKGKYRGVHTVLGWHVWKKIRAWGSDPHPYLRPAIDKARMELPALAKKYGFEYGMI